MISSSEISLYKLEQNRLALAQSYFNEELQQSKAVLFYAINGEMLTPALESFLTPNELAELVSFYDEGRKKQYAISRWLLKNLLKTMLNIPANEITFERTPLGKLFLSKSQNRIEIEFNISHTKEITILGFCKGIQIGVDVEKIRDKQSAFQVANRFFQPNEIGWINEPGLSEDLRLSRFYRLWSLKEAVIKATGGGVFKNIQQFFFTEENGKLMLKSSVEPWSCSKNWDIFEYNNIKDHACSIALYKTKANTALK